MNGLVLPLALSLRAVNGFCLGLYILVYIKVIGALALPHAPAGLTELGVSDQTLGSVYLLLMFALEVVLQVWAGVTADIRGTRFAMVLSFLLRACFFIGLAVATGFGDRPEIFFLAAAGSIVAFSVAYTTMEGNYETWLRSLLPPKDSGTRLFAISSALQYLFTIIGCLVSLACLGTAQTPAEIVGTSAIEWSFTLGAVMCVLVAIAAITIPSTIRRADRATVLMAAHEHYNALPRLRRLFYVAAVTYAVLTALSFVVPLVVLKKTSSLWERFLILALGGYGPATLGSMTSAYRGLIAAPPPSTPAEKKADAPPIHNAHETSDNPSSWRTIRLYVALFGVAATVLGGVGFLLEGPKGVTFQTVVLMTGILALARFCHGRVDPLMRALATLIIRERCPDQGEERIRYTVMSFGERLKNYAALFATGVAVVASIAGPDSHLLFYSLLTTAVAAVLVAVTLARP